MPYLPPETEQQLADMSAVEFAALSARVRPPGETVDAKTVAADALRTYINTPR